MKCRQIIYVKSAGSNARIFLIDNAKVLDSFSGYIGEGGASKTKREGDRKTPAGLFPIEYAFGTEDLRLNMPYRKITSECVFIDDSASPHYNTWQFSGSGERLCEYPAYKYALCIGYNKKRIKDAGSAIFMHISEGKPTAGCVAADEQNMLLILKWLKKEKNPYILID